MVLGPRVDQFYTNHTLAYKLTRTVLQRWKDKDVLYVEPSAGDGAFLNPIKQYGHTVRGLDLYPKSAGIKQGDFFKPNGLFRGNHENIVVIGNPPFGKNASLAVKFFNHAAQHANEIAFIVPRTFRKRSIHARLNKYFHLVKDEDIPDRSFIRMGNPYDVPSAWQIWTRKRTPRKLLTVPNIDHLISYTTPQKAEFAMRRVGFYSGRVFTSGILNLSQTSHYFLQEMTHGIIELIKTVDWPEITSQTAGSRSLSKAEIAFKLDEIYKSH